MRDYIASRLNDDRGADLIEWTVISAIVVIAGIAIGSMLTRSIGRKAADASNCIKGSAQIISGKTSNKQECKSTDTGTYTYGN